MGTGQQVDHHGRNVGPGGDTPARDQAPGEIPVPARHQDQGAAGKDVAVHHADHSGGVKHRHHSQCDALGRRVGPVISRHDVVHDVGVQVHAALGPAGGAAGVGQDGQVVRTHRERRRRVVGLQCVGPGEATPRLQIGHGVTRAQPVFPGRRWRFFAACRSIEGIAEMRHHHGPQPLRRFQRGAGSGELSCQVGAGDGHLDIRVGDVVLEFLGPVHRIDRNHHGVGAQDGKVRDHQLRAVLHA